MLLSLVAYRAEPKWEAIAVMAAQGHEHEQACLARRKRDRRQRSWWRHEQSAIRCAVASAMHHSARRLRHVDAGALGVIRRDDTQHWVALCPSVEAALNDEDCWW